jgi:hypothetical protein
MGRNSGFTQLPSMANLSGIQYSLGTTTPLSWEGLKTAIKNRYHLVMTNSSPWKIPTINGGLVRWENHLFLWAMASMAILVITRG